MALLRELRLDRRLWSGAHIVSWFWLVGFVALSLLPTLVKTSLGGIEGVVTTCLAVFTVGIAIGSGLAAWASHGRPNLSLVPLGALLMGLFALVIAGVAWISAPGPEPIGPSALLASGTGLALLVALCGLAVAGGLFIVPSFAAVQAWAPVDRRARVIAAVNVLNAAYMVGAGGIVAVLQAVGRRRAGAVCRARRAQHCRHCGRRARLGRRRAARCRPLALRHTGNLMQLRAGVSKWDDGPARVP